MLRVSRRRRCPKDERLLEHVAGRPFAVTFHVTFHETAAPPDPPPAHADAHSEGRCPLLICIYDWAL